MSSGKPPYDGFYADHPVGSKGFIQAMFAAFKARNALVDIQIEQRKRMGKSADIVELDQWKADQSRKNKP